MSLAQQKKAIAKTANEVMAQYNSGLISFEEMWNALTALVVENHKTTPDQKEVVFRNCKSAPMVLVAIMNAPFAREAA